MSFFIKKILIVVDFIICPHSLILSTRSKSRFVGLTACIIVLSQSTSLHITREKEHYQFLYVVVGLPHASSFTEARKRQMARLQGAKPPTARAAMALAKMPMEGAAALPHSGSRGSGRRHKDGCVGAR